MSAEAQQAGYKGRYVQGFQFYLKQSEEHKAILQFIEKALPEELSRIGEGKSNMDVLGVGCGAGQIDVKILAVLQSKLPTMPLTVDIVEPSFELLEQFKALVANSPNLQGIPFEWHSITCGEYENQSKSKGETKQFDFISMIQMLYYVKDYPATIKFAHGLLKKNSKLLIIHEAANSGWEILWKTFRKELCTNSLSDYFSSGDIKVHLDNMGLKYEECIVPNTVDITDVFVQDSEKGELLLDFMTDQDHFRKSFTPEIRAGILDLLRTKCSSTKDGRVLFDCSLSCMLVYA